MEDDVELEEMKTYINTRNNLTGDSNESISDLGQTYITMGIDELSDNVPTTNGKSDFNFKGSGPTIMRTTTISLTV